MGKNEHSKAVLPLIEMTIALSVLAICSVITVSLFLYAHFAGEASQDMNSALMLAQTQLEKIHNLEGSPMEGVSMEGVSMEGVSMEGVSLEGLSMEGVSMEGSPMEGVSLEEMPKDITIGYDALWQETSENPVFNMKLYYTVEKGINANLISLRLTVERINKYPFLSEERKMLAELSAKAYCPDKGGFY